MSSLPQRKPKATSSNSGHLSSNPKPGSQTVILYHNSAPSPPQNKKSNSSTTSGLPLTRGEVSSISTRILLMRATIATINDGKRRRIKRSEQRERRKIPRGCEESWRIV